MRDPYIALGLPRTASPDEVKASFRRLAKLHHPDSNPGNPEALSQFQEIQRAYALLKDPDQRFRYDSGLIDANGAPRAHPFPPRRRKTARAQNASFSFEAPPAAAKEEEPEEALFSELFMSLRRAKRAEPEPAPEGPKPGPASEPVADPTPLSVVVTFEEALSGVKLPVTLPSGRKLMMSVPAGVEHNQIIRLKNAGEAKRAENLLIRVSVEPHPVFARSGPDITCDLAVSLADAILGGKVRVPTLQGEVMVQIPDGANTGTVLKLRGRGVPLAKGASGDQLVTLKIVLPEPQDADLTALLRGWAKRGPQRARG